MSDPKASCLSIVFYLLMKSLATARAYRQGVHPWVISSCVFLFFCKYVMCAKVQETEGISLFFCDTERRDGLGVECLVPGNEGGPVDVYERAWEWV